MPRQRAVAVLLSSLIVLAGLWIVLVGDETASTVPEIVTDQPTTTSPGIVSGAAADPAGEDVTVSASIDGEELDGSPDEEMDGDRNEFEFRIPRGNKGKQLKITAVTSDGRESTVYIPIG